MTDFLAKPIDADKLRDVIERVMSGRVAPAKQLSGAGAAFDAKPLDALRQQLGAPAVAEIVQSCRSEVPALLQQLERCVAGNAVDEATDLLRALRGALSSLGFVAAADYCRTQSEALAAGKPTDAQLAEVLDRLIGAGWAICDAFVTRAKTTEPLASAA